MRKAVALAAVLLSSLGAAPAAMAQCSLTGWCVVSKNAEAAMYMKPVSRNGQYVTVDVRLVEEYPGAPLSKSIRRVYDCVTGRWRFEDEQVWRDVLPGTNGEASIGFACR